MDWRDRGACLGEDPELFFPVGTSGPARVQILEAKAVCARCPVLAECRQWALATREPYGVLGGMSEDERRAVLRRRDDRRVAPKPVEYCHGKRNRHPRTAHNTAITDAGGKRCLDCEADNRRRNSQKPRIRRRKPVKVA